MLQRRAVGLTSRGEYTMDSRKLTRLLLKGISSQDRGRASRDDLKTLAGHAPELDLGPRHDVHYWNLDWLAPRDDLKAQGAISSIPLLVAGRHVSRPAATRDSRIFYVIPQQRVVRCHDLNSRKSTTVYRWSDSERVVSVAAAEEHVYLLDAAGPSVALVRRSSEGEWSIARRWPLASVPPAGEQSRLVVAADESLGVDVAFIGPSVRGTLLKVALVEGTPCAEEVVIRIATGTGLRHAPLGNDWSFCVDDRKRTVLVADAANHRVLEADSTTGEAAVLCGSGQPGMAQAGEEAASARLNAPLDVALYRPGDVDLDNLANQSQEVLRLSDGVLPRTVVIADSGNYRLVKVVEFPPKQILAPAIPPGQADPFTGIAGRRRVYGLIGSTEVPERRTTVPPPMVRDLRAYPLYKPVQLAVSRWGEIVVVMDEAQYLLHLRSATAAAGVETTSKAKHFSTDIT